MITNSSPLATNTSTVSSNKCNHNAPKIKTEDYHNQVVKKRRTTNEVPTTKKKTQPSITTFVSCNKQTTLKEEEYFTLPSHIDGFNLLSLRRHFHSVRTKPNIIALIKKSVINNNTLPSTSKSPPVKRYSQRSLLANESPQLVPATNDVIYLNNSLHRCYVEDFIALPIGSNISILIPKKIVILSKKKKGQKCIDPKLIKIVDLIQPSLTRIGGPNDLYYVVRASVSSTPNRDAAYSGIDRISLKNGLHGTQKYGSVVSINGCSITPLIKWRDVLNAGKDGMQVRQFNTFPHTEIY